MLFGPYLQQTESYASELCSKRALARAIQHRSGAGPGLACTVGAYAVLEQEQTLLLTRLEPFLAWRNIHSISR